MKSIEFSFSSPHSLNPSTMKEIGGNNDVAMTVEAVAWSTPTGQIESETKRNRGKEQRKKSRVCKRKRRGWEVVGNNEEIKKGLHYCHQFLLYSNLFSF